MQAKSVLYAAVGAPVVAARKVGDQVASLRERVSKESTGYTEAASKAMDRWAVEGEKVLAKIGDGKVVEEISQKVDLDQAKEQVSKLRDQLEDMLATWRTSFRPEKEGEDKAAPEPAAESTTAKKTAASKAPGKGKKPAAKKTASNSKTSAAKTTPAKGGTSSKAAKASSAKTQAAKAKAS